MAIITDINDNSFKLEVSGVTQILPKGFMFKSNGAGLKLYNQFEDDDIMTEFIPYADWTVDAATFVDIESLQTALAAVVFSPASGSGADISNIKTATVNYELILEDSNSLVRSNSGSDITITVPPNATVDFPIGTQILILRYGAGEADMVAGAGVTINSKSSELAIDSQYSMASLIHIATDEWQLAGDLKA